MKIIHIGILLTSTVFTGAAYAAPDKIGAYIGAGAGYRKVDTNINFEDNDIGWGANIQA